MPISKVEYLVDGAVIGTTTSEPFNKFTWGGSPTPGTYAITAKIYVDGVLSHTSPAVNINVEEPSNSFPTWYLTGNYGQQFLDAHAMSFPQSFDYNTAPAPVIGNTNWSFYASIMGPNGIIYRFPAGSSGIAKIDTNTDTINYIGDIYGGGTSLSDVNWRTATLTNNQKIILPPYNGNNVLVFDILTETYELIPISVSGSYKYKVSLLADNGKVYFFPNSDTLPLVIFDPNDNTYITISNDGYLFRPMVLGSNGAFYGSAFYGGANYIIKLNPTDNTIIRIVEGTAVNTLLAPDGRIILLDRSNIRQLDTSTDTIILNTQVWLTSNVINEENPPCFGPDNMIYYFPRSGNNASPKEYIFYRIDIDNIGTLNSHVTIHSTETSMTFVGCILSPNGKIYGMPWTNDVHTLGVADKTLDENYILSRYINKH